MIKNKTIIDIAFGIKIEFDDLNGKFTKLHKLIAHSHTIPITDISTITLAITDDMSEYRRLLPNKVTPKLHILEHHCVRLIKR